MNDKKYAEKQVYKVLIKAPIDKVWSELVDTSRPRPFFWNGSWDTPAFAAGSPYRVSSNQGSDALKPRSAAPGLPELLLDVGPQVVRGEPDVRERTRGRGDRHATTPTRSWAQVMKPL